jgi:phage terminase Nu1 subunit (DNA packaging protein)
MATQKELAEHLDLSPQSISDLVRKGVITVGTGRSPVNLDVCRIQYITFLRKAARYTKKDGTGDIAEEKTKLTAAQARKAELEADQLEGKLIPSDLVQETWTSFVANARAKLLALPSKLAHLLITIEKYTEAENLLKDNIYEALQELADDGIPVSYRERIAASQQDMDSSSIADDK